MLDCLTEGLLMGAVASVDSAKRSRDIVGVKVRCVTPGYAANRFPPPSGEALQSNLCVRCAYFVFGVQDIVVGLATHPTFGDCYHVTSKSGASLALT